MKKFVLLVVLAMFVAVPAAFAAGLGTAIIIPPTTLSGFSSIGSNSIVSATGTSVIHPIGATSTVIGGVTTVTDPTSYLVIPNVAKLDQAAGMGVILAIAGGVQVQSPLVAMTASAGANSGGTASVTGQISTYSVGAVNNGLVNAPISSAWSY